MASLTVEIVTPEAALWTGEATGLMARSSEGEFTILPQHTPTVGDIVPGLVRVATSSGELAFCIHGGYFQVGAGDEPGVTRATVLAGIAERVNEIDVARAQIAKETAEAQLASNGDLDEGSRSQLLGSLARAELRLRVAAR
ncbi:MAG: ATP synthase F1 subunit epsilon [Acidimicrobiaceae bacterium]|nr:ATP synthase F1 subunit epsilon [Acidimicrobiaceae bacterium]